MKNVRPGRSNALLKQATQTDRAVLGMRDMVLRGSVRAGKRLTELGMVDVLGVSRTPVRAALQRLAAEGLLQSAQPNGYVVRSFSEAEIFDAIEIRGALEGLAARMAAERGVPAATLDDLKDCLAAVDTLLATAAPGDEQLSRYGTLNARFHGLLVEAAGSAMVERILATVVSLPFAAPDAFVSAQARIPDSLAILRIAQTQHYEIVAALEARSSARAEPLVREHARIARRNLELALHSADALTHLAGGALIRRAGHG